MASVRAASPDGIQVILCLKFASRAPFDQIAEAKHSLAGDAQVIHSVEVSGSFDLMVEVVCADLGSYQLLLDRFSSRFGHLVDRYEANFICRHFVRSNELESRCLWVPSGTGSQRIDHDAIDRVTAEGDYVRVHCNGTSWLLHATMKSICEELDPARFIQINRSMIVRRDFIDRLKHSSRTWLVSLVDGSEHRIAKSRSAVVLATLKDDSSTRKARSSIFRIPADSTPPRVEKMVQAGS